MNEDSKIKKLSDIFDRYLEICIEERRCIEIDIKRDVISTYISISRVNIWNIFDIDILKSMFIKWENDTCFSVLKVNIWYTFIVDILELMLLEWEKKSCSIEFVLEICDYENLIKNN